MEKRKYMRFDVLLNALGRAGDESKKLKVTNFCREGIGISSEDYLPEGKDVDVEMMIPGDNIPVVVTGEITWAADSSSDDQQYEGGMKFKEIKDSDRGRILEYVYQKWLMPRKSK